MTKNVVWLLYAMIYPYFIEESWRRSLTMSWPTYVLLMTDTDFAESNFRKSPTYISWRKLMVNLTSNTIWASISNVKSSYCQWDMFLHSLPCRCAFSEWAFQSQRSTCMRCKNGPSGRRLTVRSTPKERFHRIPRSRRSWEGCHAHKYGNRLLESR